jgi:hypothetical protein
MDTMAHNICFWTALTAWTFAQGVKMASRFAATRRIDFRILVSTGGMPSAHTAMVCGLATQVGFVAGFASPLFAVTAAFASVVMFDAQSVRRAAGQQARLLNQIVEELFKEHHLSEQKLAELLGHTRMEVFGGMVTGVLIAMLIHAHFGGGA